MSRATARNDAPPPASGRKVRSPRVTGEFLRDPEARTSGELTLGGLVESGVTLARLYDSDLFSHFRPAVRLRFVHDALESLAVLQMNPRLEAAHPDLVITPQTVVIGLDGAARVNLRLARQTTAAGENASDVDFVGSQELRQGASRAGVRPDVYSFGVLAWEALRGERLAPGLRRGAEALLNDLTTLDVEEAWMKHFIELTQAALGALPNASELRPRALMAMLAPTLDALVARQQIADSIQGIQSVTALCVQRPKPPAPSHACDEGPDPRGAARAAQPCEVRAEDSCSPSTQRRPLAVASDLVSPSTTHGTTPKPSGKAVAGEEVAAQTRKPVTRPNGAYWLLLVVLLLVVGAAAGLSVHLFIGLT